MSVIQHNPKFIVEYIKLTRPFRNWLGRFSPRKYHKFFTKGPTQKIQLFYEEAQNFINKLIVHIHQNEGGKNQWSRYFIDLTILLASNVDTPFRAQSIDNRRTSVDVTSFDLDSVFNEIECHRKEAIKNNPNLCFISVPTDFSLLYNVGDMLTVGFDTGNRKLIYPKLIEVKDRKSNRNLYKQDLEKQIQRERKQALRFAELHTKYDFFKSVEDRRLFYGYPIYLSEHLARKLLRWPRIVKIDDVFSLESSMGVLKHDDNYWKIDILEEMVCGNIIPMIFKGFDVELFNKIMSNGPRLYITVDKKDFRKKLQKLDFVSKMDKHSSPYHNFIYFGDMRISAANLIHVKYPIQQLKHLLKVVHLGYSKKIEEQKNKPPRYFYFGP